MITQLILDTNTPAGLLRAGTPVEFLEFVPGWSRPDTNGKHEYVAVRLPNNQQCEIDAARVSSGIHSPEETLPVLAEKVGLHQDTLLKAIKSGRLMARRSGATWLSTLNAVEYAVSEGKIRK
jgi:hypothetical protein